MSTVTATPAFGSVEHFAEKLRRCSTHWTNIDLLAYEFVKVIADSDYLDPAERMRRVANLIAAADLVRAENEAAGR